MTVYTCHGRSINAAAAGIETGIAWKNSIFQPYQVRRALCVGPCQIIFCRALANHVCSSSRHVFKELLELQIDLKSCISVPQTDVGLRHHQLVQLLFTVPSHCQRPKFSSRHDYHIVSNDHLEIEASTMQGLNQINLRPTACSGH